VAPAYIAESAPVSVRGSMLVTFQIATTSGIAVAYFVGAALAGTESWRFILSLSAIPAIIVLVLIVRLPDTARWLLMNGQREEAADLLRRIRLETTHFSSSIHRRCASKTIEEGYKSCGKSLLSCFLVPCFRSF
jgi:MFS transporter, SP family, galactose:H+ symporter